MIKSSSELSEYARHLDAGAKLASEPELQETRQWLANVFFVLADQAAVLESLGIPEARPDPEPTSESEAQAPVTAVAVCPSCQAKVNEVHKPDCPVAAYLRQTGYVNPNVSALKEAVMNSANPVVIPRCPECGAQGGHFTTCSTIQAVAGAQGW